MKNAIIITIVLLASTPMWSQYRSDKHNDKIAALRIAYITEELQLSSSEAQLFWPLFNQHEMSQEALRQDRYSLLDLTSDRSHTDILVDYVDNRASQHTLTKEYINQLKGVLSDEKIVKLLALDKKFRQRLLNRLNDKRDEKK